MANDLRNAAAPSTTVAKSGTDASHRAHGRERGRRHRRRRAAGEFCVSLQLPAAETEDVLIDLGFLASELADDRAAVCAALERFVRSAILDASSL